MKLVKNWDYYRKHSWDGTSRTRLCYRPLLYFIISFSTLFRPGLCPVFVAESEMRIYNECNISWSRTLSDFLFRMIQNAFKYSLGWVFTPKSLIQLINCHKFTRSEKFNVHSQNKFGILFPTDPPLNVPFFNLFRDQIPAEKIIAMVCKPVRPLLSQVLEI